MIKVCYLDEYWLVKIQCTMYNYVKSKTLVEIAYKKSEEMPDVGPWREFQF